MTRTVTWLPVGAKNELTELTLAQLELPFCDPVLTSGRSITLTMDPELLRRLLDSTRDQA